MSKTLSPFVCVHSCGSLKQEGESEEHSLFAPSSFHFHDLHLELEKNLESITVIIILITCFSIIFNSKAFHPALKKEGKSRKSCSYVLVLTRARAVVQYMEKSTRSVSETMAK